MSKKPSGQGKNKNNKKKGPLGGGPKPGSQQAKANKERELDKLLTRSEQLWEKGDSDASLDILDDVIERYPRDSRALVLSAMICAELGDMDEALNRAEIAETIDPDNPVLLNFLSMAYLMDERIASSLRVLRRLRATDSTGQFFDKENQERLNLAEQILKQEALEYKVPPAMLEKAMLLMEQGDAAALESDFDRGLELLTEASELIPGWIPPRLNRTVFLWQAGKAEESLQASDQLLKEVPDDYSVLSQKISILLWTGQTEQAKPLVTRLEEIFVRESAKLASADEAERDTVVPLFYKTAGIYATLGEHQRVYDILKQGESADLEYSDDEWRWLAIASHNLGKTSEADQYWQKIEAEEQTPFDLGLKQAIQRPLPADAPPLTLPYLETASFLPLQVMQLLLVTRESEQEEEGVEFDTEQIKLAYSQLSRFYPIMQGLVQNIKFSLQPIAETNVGIMGEIHNAEVSAALKEYALGYVGSEMARRYALAHLVEWGEVPKDGTVHFWIEQPGEWQDLPVSSFATLEEEAIRILDDVFDFSDMEEE